MHTVYRTSYIFLNWAKIIYKYIEPVYKIGKLFGIFYCIGLLVNRYRYNIEYNIDFLDTVGIKDNYL